ncbi:MAG: hypothetical protein IH804_08855, partial [Planctomycetes bacterium]|nr:hypothetical protein [Planctomycetota bacterium]
MLGQLDSFTVATQPPIGAELAAAVSLTNSSHNADAAALWLLATGTAVAIAAAVGLLRFVGRSILRRRPALPLHGNQA